MTALASPQPYESLPHTADAGVRVRGKTPEETLARMVLALAQTVSGGAMLEAKQERELRLEGGVELDALVVDVLRAVLTLIECEALVPMAVRVDSFGLKGATLVLSLAAYDEERCREGLVLKAVTYHAARFARDDGGYVAQVVFDL